MQCKKEYKNTRWAKRKFPNKSVDNSTKDYLLLYPVKVFGKLRGVINKLVN